MRPRKIYRLFNTVIRGCSPTPTVFLTGARWTPDRVDHNQAKEQCHWTTIGRPTERPKIATSSNPAVTEKPNTFSDIHITVDSQGFNIVRQIMCIADGIHTRSQYQ